MVRGIHNYAKTACHLSSALLCICHFLVPIRTALIQLSKTYQGNSFLRGMGSFLEELVLEGNARAVDPTRFYQIVHESLGIEAQELGDAVTALVKLLQCIRQDCPILHPLLQATVDAGRVHSVIRGTRIEGDEIVKYEKELKMRTMPCPFALPGDCDSIDAALKKVLAPQNLEGYQWSTTNEMGRLALVEARRTDEVDMEELNFTKKALYIDAVPPLWILNLERFENKEGRRRPLENTIDVPMAQRVVSGNKSFQYCLLGGILHVVDDADGEEEEEEEGGHYVVAVRQGEQWIFLDDDETTFVSEETVLKLLRGSSNTATNRGSKMQGVVVAYERIDAADSIEPVLAKLVDELKTCEIDWTQPDKLVGRRLRIKWAKGKYYEGVIASYNSATGKHVVNYNDGDVREYDLQKKTIEWL